MFELFEHTADLGLRVRAPDLDTLFREAAEGLFSMVVERWEPDDTSREYRFALRAGRRDDLFFDWLNELLYTFETEHRLLGRFEVRVAGMELTARALGTRLDPEVHRTLHEVKAITYHGLKVEQRGADWLAEVVVDI